MSSSVRETSVTREELRRRTSALMPALKERAARTEQLRQMPPETVQDLVSSGLIRLGNPQRYGGLGVEYDAAFDVSWELGRACGSTAWCYSLWTVHNWWVGHFPALAQEEFFASGPDTLASSALNPTRGQAEPVAGGLRVSGHWSFSSGCDAASWAMLAVPHPNGLIWTLLPRPDYDILDTWFTSGMRGTGSKDIVVRDAFVPEHRTLDPSRAGDGEWTGWELHRRLSYRLPLRCMTGWDLVAPLIGIAQGAVDAFTARLRGTSGPGRTADSVLVQVRLAEASIEVDAAREGSASRPSTGCSRRAVAVPFLSPRRSSAATAMPTPRHTIKASVGTLPPRISAASPWGSPQRPGAMAERRGVLHRTRVLDPRG